MANSISFQIEGIEAIKKMLSDLPKSVSEKVQSDLHRQGAKIVADELKAAAPEGDNSKKSKNKVVNNILVKRGAGSSWAIGFSKRAGYIARFNEYGTKVRATTGKGKYKAGANRGTMQRRPFVRQAHERAYPKAVDFMVKNYAKIVNRSVKSQANRLKKKTK